MSRCRASSFRRMAMECLESRTLLDAGSATDDLASLEATEPLGATALEATTGSDRLFALHVSSTSGRIYEIDPESGVEINNFATPTFTAQSGFKGLALGPRNLFFIEGDGNGAHTLYELDPSTGVIIDSDVVDSAGSPSISGLGYLDGLVYMARPSNRTLLAWNPLTDSVVKTLTVSNFTVSGGLTGAHDLGLLYDSNALGDVAAISPQDGHVVQQLHTGSNALSGGLAYANGQLLGGNYGTGEICRIDPSTGAVVGRFTVPGTSGTLAGLAGDGASHATSQLRGNLWSD
ncbi:MAG: NHL repeat-containing protein, partial [Thermoguttaceae bacterium]